MGKHQGGGKRTRPRAALKPQIRSESESHSARHSRQQRAGGSMVALRRGSCRRQCRKPHPGDQAVRHCRPQAGAALGTAAGSSLSGRPAPTGSRGLAGSGRKRTAGSSSSGEAAGSFFTETTGDHAVRLCRLQVGRALGTAAGSSLTGRAAGSSTQASAGSAGSSGSGWKSCDTSG